MVEDSKSRRTVLKGAGIAGVTGLTASLAGCTGGENGSDVDGADELGDEVPEIELVAPTAGTNPFRNELAQIVAENWEEIGFDVELEELEFGAHVDKAVVQQDYDASLLGWGGTPERIDPHTFIYDMHHSDNTQEGGRNTPGWENDEYDELAELQVTQVDEEERQQTVYDAQEMIAEAQPRTYIANEGGYHPYASARVENVDPTLGEGLNSFWNMISATPTDDDTVRFGYPSEIISLNPMQDLATPDRQFVRLLYDQLYRIGPDGFPQPWLATDDPEIEDDGMTYTVEIRDDVTFHDGEDLTIDDVEFTYELYADSPTYGSLVEIIDEIETSGNEITFHLEEQYAPFTANVLGQVYIFPEHIWGDVAPDELVDFEDENWTGSGPFQFRDWERQSELQLEAFDDHFETPNADNFIRIPGADTAQLVNDLEAGQIDMVGAVPQPTAVDRVRDDDDLALAEFEAIGYAMIEYNTRREPFDDRHVRRALSYGVPKEEYVEFIRDGMGTVTHTTISEHNEFWHNPDVEEFYEDLEAAREELAEGGYGWDDDDRLHYGA
ncbi:ABC transporter substrate-binding protein [Natronobacterium texcoconense]|uniref:Peptide/nickel transport system substrate-binding protein n=1 Tax=Natronobacterium texcoconense TaxID=1095778 RepID=A0A1H1IR91_NATTX|nr:ABC transporter substrate-binding protein [Natronobacterium texcoconense]SDR40234.1 peptide/nickel transport system substrate-binding protein [Natronobacterium texcoconense]